MPFGSKPNNPILLMLAGGASLNVGLRIWFDIAWVPDPHWRASSYHLDVTSSAFCFKPRGFLGPRDSAHGLWALNTSQVCQKGFLVFVKVTVSMVQNTFRHDCQVILGMSKVPLMPYTCRFYYPWISVSAWGLGSPKITKAKLYLTSYFTNEPKGV